MSYFTRDATEEIREAGRGHLIPDYDRQNADDHEAALYYARFGILDEQNTPEDIEWFEAEDDSDRRFEQGQYEGDE